MKPYYDDGTCTIYHGDCRELITSAQVNLRHCPDVLVTDPPYGISHQMHGDNDGLRRETPWVRTEIIGDASTAVRDEVLATWGDRPALVFGSWKATRPAGTRAVLIWDKGPASGMGAMDLPWKPSHEEIYVLGRGFTGQRTEGILKGHRVVSWVSLGRSHPHEKPVDLLRELVGKCPPGTVLDPFMGSGTTLRAAKDLRRRAIGIEIEERYCEVAAKRLGQEVLAL